MDELKAAYGTRGLAEENGSFTLPVAEKPGWVYRFTAVGGKVASLVLTPELGCAA
jgi:hypothetical protein